MARLPAAKRLTAKRRYAAAVLANKLFRHRFLHHLFHLFCFKSSSSALEVSFYYYYSKLSFIIAYLFLCVLKQFFAFFVCVVENKRQL